MVQQIQHDCPHCGTKQMSFTLQMTAVVTPRPSTTTKTSDVRLAAFLTCNNQECRMPVAALFEPTPDLMRRMSTAVSNSEVIPYTKVGGLPFLNPEFWTLECLWPTVQAPDIPKNLPANVERAFKEGEMGRAARAFESAATMYGKALDIASYQIGDEATKTAMKSIDKLHNRLVAMGARNLIPKELSELAIELKWARNDSMHEAEPPRKEDVDAIAEATRLILIYLFELPVRAAELRTKYNPHHHVGAQAATQTAGAK